MLIIAIIRWTLLLLWPSINNISTQLNPMLRLTSYRELVQWSFHRISVELVFLFAISPVGVETDGNFAARHFQVDLPGQEQERTTGPSSPFCIARCSHVMTFRTSLLFQHIFHSNALPLLLLCLIQTTTTRSEKRRTLSSFLFLFFIVRCRTAWLTRTRHHQTEFTTTFVKRQPRRLSILCREHWRHRRRFTAMEMDRQQVEI